MADPKLVTSGVVGVFALVVAYSAVASGHSLAALGALCVVAGAACVLAADRVDFSTSRRLTRGGIALAVLGALVYAAAV